MKKSRNKTKMIIAVLLIFASLVILIWYSFSTNQYRIALGEKESYLLSRQEEAWIKEHPEVKITIDKGLSLSPNQEVFFSLYLNKLMGRSGLEVRLDSTGEAEGRLVAITNENRAAMTEGLITKPLLKIEGHAFVKQQRQEKEVYEGVAIEGTFTEQEEKKLRFNGNKIHLTEVADMQGAMALAKGQEVDLILGEVNATDRALGEEGLLGSYEDSNQVVFAHNVCLVLPPSEMTLYDILTMAITEADKERLLRNAQEEVGIKLLLASGEKNYSDSFVFLIIIFLTVFGGFFIYYLTTKNLYEELTTRMEQLTESKTEMETTFNGVPFYMAEIDREGMVLTMNKAMREALKIIGNTFERKDVTLLLNMPEEVQVEIKKAITRAAEKGGGQNCIATLKRQIFDIDIYPIETKQRGTQKFLFMAADVTGVKMAEKQMLQQNKMIAVGQLAAGVAHEIRNPLGLIRNYCYVLKDEAHSKEQREQAIKVIEKAVDTSGKIITNLLNFSKVSSSEPEEILLKNHIDSVVLINQGMLKKKNISITVMGEPIRVKLRRESFDMILINLLSNSVDAISGNGKIAIGLAHDGEELALTFSDTGCGIDKETLEDIFNPFFTTKGSSGGNGLGLYIVYNEVEKMNGRIQVESKEGEGTTFRIYLPVAVERTESFA